MGAMIDSLERRELLELALRPLGALGTAPEFPQDQAGIEALIERLPRGRPSEPKDFAYESGDELPRYDERTIWLSPAGDGALRIRRQGFDRLGSVAVVLHPDGRTGEFEKFEGFGVPDAELTEAARADREAFERRRHEAEEVDADWEERLAEEQTRFATGKLIRSVAAPAGQDPAGPVVTHLTLYETGVMVDYMVPRPREEVLHLDDPDDPFAEPEMEAMFPRVEIDDGLGTDYRGVDLRHVDANGPMLRARRVFAPPVPAEAAELRVIFDAVTVAVDLEER
jgi:hypothetical protein